MRPVNAAPDAPNANSEQPESHPPLSDTAYWVRRGNDVGYGGIKIETLIQLFQDRDAHCDREVVEDVLAFLLAAARWLFEMVVGNKDHLPGGREEVIEQALQKVRKALLAPDTPDGRHVRVRFWFVSKFRALDAIRRSERRAKRLSELSQNAAGVMGHDPWGRIDTAISIDQVLERTESEMDRAILELALVRNERQADIVRLLGLRNRWQVSRALRRVRKMF